MEWVQRESSPWWLVKLFAFFHVLCDRCGACGRGCDDEILCGDAEC